MANSKSNPETSLATSHASPLASTKALATNPHKSASLAMIDPDLPAGMMSVGRVPWEDYAAIEEGAIIRGELLTVVKRWVNDDEDPTAEQQARFSLVMRTTVPLKCSRLYKGEEESGKPRGELVVEKFQGMTKTYDVYTVGEGVLFATTLRKILTPLVVFTKGREAFEAYIRVLSRELVKGNAKQSYWNMKQGVAPLGYARDASLDFLSKQADFMKSAMSEDTLSDDVPF